jgi:hypothetical protein
MARIMVKHVFWTKLHKKGNIIIIVIGEIRVAINVNADLNWNHIFFIWHALKFVCSLFLNFATLHGNDHTIEIKFVYVVFFILKGVLKDTEGEIFSIKFIIDP